MFATIMQKKRLLTFYFSTKRSKFQKLGFKWLLKEVSMRGFKELGWLLLLPFAISIHLLGFRRIPILIQHIGHLTLETDTFIKARQLGFIPKRRYFILALPHKVSNAHLLVYWGEQVKVISHPVFCIFLEIATRRYFALCKSQYHQLKVFGGTQEIYRINQLWGERPPILRLSEEDEAWSSRALNELGITKNQWFVCIHVREGGFLPQNEPLHDFRNASIKNTLLAIQEIVKRGGIVVRVGDATMKLLPAMPGVIDYVQHPLKSDRMDVVLCAKALFFLGNTSGLAFLSMIFGVPVAHANMIPVDTLGFRFSDLSIPKLVWSEPLRRYLSFKELFSSEKGSYFYSRQYKEAGLRVDENSPEEILLLVTEMLDRLDGKFVENEEDRKLHQSYLDFLKLGHYSYQAASRICIAFLRQYQKLLT